MEYVTKHSKYKRHNYYITYVYEIAEIVWGRG